MNSEQTNEIAAALAKAQGAMASAKYNKINPHFRSKYADLAAIIDAIKKPLADNGIGYTQTTHMSPPDYSVLVLVTKLMHSSGQWIDSVYPLPNAPDKPQVMGSALTYARRYELASICGIAAEEDNDAEGVAEAVVRKPKFKPDVMQAPPDPQTGEVSEPKPIDPALENKQNDWTSFNPDIQEQARQAASRGYEVMKQFYNARSKDEKAKIDAIRSELNKLVDDAERIEADESANDGEGS